MPQSGGNPNDAWCSSRSEGGVGAATYSVKARLFILALIGVSVPSVMVAIQGQAKRDALIRRSKTEKQERCVCCDSGWKLIKIP